jgi:hypothetical protein
MNRTLILAAAAALALALAPVSAALSAAADTTPTSASDPNWSVQASGVSGPDGRASFAYGVNPGTEIDDYVSVSNHGTTTQTFSVYGTDAITLKDSGAFSLLTAAQKPRDVGAWITTKTSSLTVEPGQTGIVPVVILVPSDASPGDHTGGVIASVVTAAHTQKGGAGVGIDQRVAARVYLRVSGQPISHVVATGLVSGFTPAWNPFGVGTATLDYSLRNTGNVREDVAQAITFHGPFGIPLGALKAASVSNLLPGQSVQIHQSAPVFPLLLLFADVKLTPSAPTDLIGQSKLRDQAGNALPPLPEPKFAAVSSSTFGAAISWTALIIVLVLVALVFLVTRYVRTTRERMFDAIDAATEQARQDALAQAAAARETVGAGAQGPKS